MCIIGIADAFRPSVRLCVCVCRCASICSLKLIKGSLDQVDQKAQITWVQPRVLSREQIGQLAQRLSVWNSKLHRVEERIAPEVLVNS